MQKLAQSWSSVLDRYNQTGKSQAVLAYGLEIILLYTFQYSLFFLYAWLVGLFWETALFLLAFHLLRTVSGGAHNASHRGCTATSLLVLSLFFLSSRFALTPSLIFPVLFLTAGLWGAAVVFWVPAPNPHRSIDKPDAIRRFKRLSAVRAGILFLIAAFLPFTPYGDWAWPIVAAALWQVFTLSPVGYGFIRWTDKVYAQFKLG